MQYTLTGFYWSWHHRKLHLSLQLEMVIGQLLDIQSRLVHWDMSPNLGTQVQCRSQKFQKTNRYLSEFCQKTVGFKNVSENSHKWSEFCQKTVRCKYLSEIYQKTFKIASEMCQILKICQKTVTSCCQKTVRNLS